MSAVPFALPSDLEAHAPPETAGLSRDAVRLLVARRSDCSVTDTHFSELPRFLDAGDLLVVNNSATMPAALDAVYGDLDLELHLSTPLPTDEKKWVIELRMADEPFDAVDVGAWIALPGQGRVEILAPYLDGRRLWIARLDLPLSLHDYLARYGRPIRYRYVSKRWPLESYQNAYAQEPGSAEMASAGRPLTAELVARLLGKGILLAPITLHAGVSSPDRHERPFPERFRVGAETARLVNAVHSWGGRVIAVGTTVVRALETVAEPDGTVAPGAGWTRLVVTPARGVSAVDGLISGWHESEASHLDLLSAVAGDELLRRSYERALTEGYRWHEFGDSHLILP
jgi:S-adenosylmethionine:tRNA ribosyltransferase-isomerase